MSYYSDQAEEGTILCDDELVDTRNGYTYRVVSYHVEQDTFWIRYDGIRERDWEQLYVGDDEDISLRMQYAQTIASLCTLQGVVIPETISMHLTQEVHPDEHASDGLKP